MDTKSKDINNFASIAAKKDRCRSCIMVDELPYLNEFRSLGIEEIRTNKDGILIVNVPTEKIALFVDLYLSVMQSGRWNEYVGPQSGFYFKMPNGEKSHIIFESAGFEKIVESLNLFLPNWKIQNENELWEWISKIDIYHDWLR